MKKESLHKILQLAFKQMFSWTQEIHFHPTKEGIAAFHLVVAKYTWDIYVRCSFALRDLTIGKKHKDSSDSRLSARINWISNTETRQSQINITRIRDTNIVD